MPSLYSPKDEALRFIQVLTGYAPNNPSLIWEALQVAGNGNTPGNKDGNKDLALVGDAILSLHVIIEGRQRHQCRERINKVESSLGANSSLARKGFKLGLESYIQGNQSQRGEISDRTMATTVEAIIGAIFVDSGCDYSVLPDVMARLGLGWPQ
ncbi:uncharacterized protein BHQ10_000149 [Talaromyces amestolkiae]|uniref:RNase III domain-containing protein n=1 Tax=Talaromyces amestolkiae TaxID=1196081 RepID=A0A364KKR6_TALAM|nr:uncharacterized protein BHQ10_000149 [Talaromyces amestolkiae]RAO64137.1 hypothetical protein BHQ10_000149 [Talaromyces amestolkiae]